MSQTQTVGQAVVKRDDLSKFVKTYERVFAETLPKHIETHAFIRLAQGLLRRNADLAAAAVSNPESLLAALLDCSRLGHEPGTDRYALTVRKMKGVPTIVGIEQYQGVIERMYRAGAVVSVKCEVVRAGDHFRWAPTRMQVPEHEFDPLAPWEKRGDLVGVYAYAELASGAVSRVVVMNRDEVMKHKAKATTEVIWDAWDEPMWRKSATHELEKWVPTSSEYLQQRARAAAVVEAAKQAQPAATVRAEANSAVFDGEVVDAPATPEPPNEQPWPEAAQPGGGAQ